MRKGKVEKGKSGNNETFVIHTSVARCSKEKWGRKSKEGEGEGGQKRMGERKEGRKERER